MRNIFDLHTKVTLITGGGSGIGLGIGRQFTTMGAKVIIPGHTPQMSCDAPCTPACFAPWGILRRLLGADTGHGGVIGGMTNLKFLK